MQFNIQTAQVWWNNLELQWKTAFNEAVFGKGILAGPCTTNDPTTCASNDFAGLPDATRRIVLQR